VAVTILASLHHLCPSGNKRGGQKLARKKKTQGRKLMKGDKTGLFQMITHFKLFDRLHSLFSLEGAGIQKIDRHV
jgi:hypothetical protein